VNKGRTARTRGEQIVTDMRWAHSSHAKKHGTERELCHNFATILAYTMGVGHRSVDMTMSFDEAREYLKTKEAVSEDGGLYNLGWYLGWNPGDKEATLDGTFTADDLIAIAVFMKRGVR
jgi:hypothetical protein